MTEREQKKQMKMRIKTDIANTEFAKIALEFYKSEKTYIDIRKLMPNYNECFGDIEISDEQKNNQIENEFDDSNDNLTGLNKQTNTEENITKNINELDLLLRSNENQIQGLKLHIFVCFSFNLQLFVCVF